MLDYNLYLKPIAKETFIITGKINDLDLILKLKKDIDKGIKKRNNNYKTNVHGKMTSFKYFNGNKNFNKFINIITPYFHKITNKNLKVRDSWGNVLEGKDFVHPHDHVPNYISGILYLSDGEGTYFLDYDMLIKSEKGKFVLFDPMLKHEVKQSYINNKRYTLAFNFEMLSDFENCKQ